MIEFDESEHLETDFTDTTLNFILDLYGPAVRDMLLIKKVVYVNPDNESG